MENLENKVLSAILDAFKVEYIGGILIKKLDNNIYDTFFLNGQSIYTANSIMIQASDDDVYIDRLIKELRRIDFINPNQFQTFHSKRVQLDLNDLKYGK